MTHSTKKRFAEPGTQYWGRRACLTLLLALPLTLGFAGVASAHPGAEGMRERGPMDAMHPAKSKRMKKCREGVRAKMVKRFDSDRDGKLSPQEREIARATRKAERLGEYDKDKDGKLSKAERADFIHDRITKRFEDIDKNGDAEISNEEASSSCTPLLGRFFAKVDRDGNDSVSWTEFEKVAKKRMKRMKERRRGRRGQGRGRPGPQSHRGAGGGQF